MAEQNIYDTFAAEFNKLYQMQTDGKTQSIFIQAQRNLLNDLGRKVIFAALADNGYSKKYGINCQAFLQKVEADETGEAQ